MSTTGAQPTEKRPAPWNAGWNAARANFFPALAVQCAMLGLLIAYHRHAPTTAFLNQLAVLKEQTGWIYAAVSAMIAGALIPELLRIVFFQGGALRLRNASNLLFTIPFWSVMSVIVDQFYQLQAKLFGSDVTFSTIAIKVAVDQCIYTAFFATPFTCLLYGWKSSGYDFNAFQQALRFSFYRDQVLPALITNWAVWIPLIAIIYSLPLLLQIPISSFALSLWVLLYTWISERHHGIK